LFVGCTGLAAVVAAIRTVWPRGLDRGLLALLFLIVAAQIAGFGAAYASALMADEIRLDAWLLIDGFSNPRFYGQFLTLALPLLLVPVLSTGELRRYAAVASVITALAWMLAISSGTRGTWLGLGVAAAFLPWLGGTGRRWAIGQLLATGVGLSLFWILLSLLPGVIGAEVGHHAGTRLTTSLSGRGPLWMMTIDLVLEHPWLGVGPMHFANVPNQIAAHPHQGLLQWAAEWGAPSALAVTALVLIGGWKVMRTIRQHPASTGETDVIRLCLLASVLASLVQAMVDGVLVMPYTQLWLTLCVGWLIGLHRQVAPAQMLKVGARPQPGDTAATVDARVTRCVIGAGVAFFLAASVYLGHVVVRDTPELQAREQWFVQTAGGLYKPRFWRQGFIERDAAAWMHVKKRDRK